MTRTNDRLRLPEGPLSPDEQLKTIFPRLDSPPRWAGEVKVVWTPIEVLPDNGKVQRPHMTSPQRDERSTVGRAVVNSYSPRFAIGCDLESNDSPYPPRHGLPGRAEERHDGDGWTPAAEEDRVERSQRGPVADTD
jgi:hypothetical protein